MPGGYDYDLPSGDPAPEVPRAPRFSRDLLDPVAQKIYDQLKDQRERIEKASSPEQAAKLYTNLSGLSPDESIAMMAAELRDTGITDIYKVKKDTVTDRLPVEYGEIGSSGEGGGTYGYFYRDQFGSPVQVAQNQIKDFTKDTLAWDPNLMSTDGEGGSVTGGYRLTPASGFVEIPRTQYLNTETNQPLVRSVNRGEFAGQDDLLSDMQVGKRQFTGTGVQFTDEGVPFYYSTGIQNPSSWKRFTNSIRPLLPIAAMLIPGIGQALAPLANTLIGAVGATATPALTAAVSQGLASGIANTVATGDIGKGILSGLGAGTFNYLMAPSFNTPSPDDFIAMEGVGYDALNAADARRFFDPSLAPPELVNELFSGAPSNLTNLTSSIPQYDDFLGELISSPELPGPSGLPPIPNISPEWDTGYPSTTDVPLGSLGPRFDPFLGIEDLPSGPTPPTSELPPIPNTSPEWDTGYPSTTDVPLGSLEPGILDYLKNAGAGLAAFAATPAGRLALAIGGPMLLEKVFGDKQAGGAGAGTAGWSGTIPEYQMVRERVPLADAARRPGEYGRRYFSDTSFVPLTPGAENAEANLAAIQQAQQAAQAQAAGLAALPPGIAAQRAAPTPTAIYQTPPQQAEPAQSLYPPDFIGPLPPPGLDPNAAAPLTVEDFRRSLAEPVRAAQGGLMGLAKGRYLDGPTDGMEDKLKTTIEGEQPARLSHGEFVIPADVVSHLGNGNSQAGAKRLYDMMDKIRHARTGTKKQGRQINPDKYLPS